MILTQAATTVAALAVAPPKVQPRLRLGVSLVGVDGSTWDLYDGPVRLMPGAIGFGTGDVEHWWSDAAALDGSTYLGSRTPRREPVLPVYVRKPRGGDPLQWLEVDSAFAEATDPDGECQLMVATPDGGVRWLPIRFTGGGDADLDLDPVLIGYAAYAGLRFVAADPFWRGPDVRTRFETDPPRNLFPGPPFQIGSARAIGDGTVTNPGTRPAWPRWTITGPATDFIVGVGRATVAMTRVIPAGESIVIDTDPRRRTVLTGTGDDAWLDVTDAAFAEIPRGRDVPLSLAVNGAVQGATAVDLTFTPRYRRAW